MRECNNCKYKDCWENAEPCASCINLIGKPTNWEPQTNADRIRAMTDEELAEYLSSICYDLWKMFSDDPKKTWLDWLKSPVEVDNG